MAQLTETTETFQFTTQAERDRFLNDKYPTRICSQVPGIYEFPDDDDLFLKVYVNKVEVSRYD